MGAKRLLATCIVAVAGLAGCASPGPKPPPLPVPPSSSAAPTTPATRPTLTVPPPAPVCTPAAPPSDGVETLSQVQYDWAVPGITVSKPGGDSRGGLFAICTSDHPEENPAYSEIIFYFQGGPPPYDFNYATQVLTEAKGDPLDLMGNRFLRIHFSEVPNPGSVTPPANKAVNLHNLLNYGCSGPYEGSLTCGLGIRAGTNPSIRVAYQVRDTGNPLSSALYYGILFDVQSVP